VSGRVLLIAATTGYQTRIFADAARRLGYDLTLATDRCHVLDDPWGDQATALRFENPQASAEKLAEQQYDAVVAVGDRPALIASELAERLGLAYHPPAAVAACHDKHEARRLFAAAGLPTPEYCRVALNDDPAWAASQACYPCVLKPLGLSASRGVIRADSPAEFVRAFERIKDILHTPDLLRLGDSVNESIQVEAFIPGREFAIEGLMTAGRFHALAIFDKPDPLDGPYFEETIYVTPSRAPAIVEDALLNTARRAVAALGLRHGPVHVELRHNERGAWPLEVAARPIGGLCANALHFEGGVPLEELILRHALGADVCGFRLISPAAGVMMIPIPKSGIYESASGVEDAEREVDEVMITAKRGQRLLQLPEGASYLGFLFAWRDSPEAVEHALRAAHAKLRFEIATALPVA
jgi:formate-dependent phosphoribosylglycinamide formyltransferase (GAR transformylase)